MGRSRLKTLFTFSLFCLDASALVLAFQGAFALRFHAQWFLRLWPATKGFPSPALYNRSLLAFLPMWLLVFFYMGCYKENPISAYDELVRVVKGVVLCSLLTTALTFAYHAVEYSRLVIGLWSLFSIALVYGMRELDKLIFRQLLTRVVGPQRVAVIGRGKVTEALGKMLEHQPFIDALYLDPALSEASLKNVLAENKIPEVLLVQGGLSTDAILNISRVCEELDIDCRIVPDLLEIRRGEIVMDGFLGLPTFHLKPLSLHGSNYVLKRSFDVFLALVVLIITFIPMLLIGLLIRLDSRGPVLYSHKRLGLRGREFNCYKFRTMVHNAEELIHSLKHRSERAGPVFKMKADPRVTRVGRWLRRFSIDELPQVLNVLKGDMSWVGPRPQVLWEAAHYDEHAKKRLRVKPGVTGLWQVSGRAELSYDEMINLDIFYLENWSLGLDLKILLRTLPAIFNKVGAY
jgi:exopolysaccharide biosynthesis polyprenyl glycosylphosphotransferase